MLLKSLQINKTFIFTIIILMVLFGGFVGPTNAYAEEVVDSGEAVQNIDSDPEIVEDDALLDIGNNEEDVKDSLSDNNEQIEENVENIDESEEGEEIEDEEGIEEIVEKKSKELTNDENGEDKPKEVGGEVENKADEKEEFVEETNSIEGENQEDIIEEVIAQKPQKPFFNEETQGDKEGESEVISDENEFITTESGEEPIDPTGPEIPSITEEVSVEVDFTTLNNVPNPGPNPEPTIDEIVSLENEFVSLSDIPTSPQEVVSVENNFNTSNDGGGPGPTEPEEVVSLENDFDTENNDGGPNPTDPEEIVSIEVSFTTDSNGGGPNPTDPEEVVSGEVSFTTLSDRPVNEVVSVENSFTTDSDGGGGGGGGGGGSRRTTTEVLPSKCIPLLYKYIRLGRDNDPYEVFKLQWFLQTFEGFEVPLSGVYDQTTYEAVRIFQKRYEQNVLNTWGITDSTGYVYITTSLMVNYIYCGIDDDFDFTLNLPTNFNGTVGGDFNSISTPFVDVDNTDSLEELDLDLPTPVVTKTNNFLQAVAVGFTDFFKDINICQILAILVILLLLLILWLLYKLFRGQKENDLLRESNDMMTEANNEMRGVPFGVFVGDSDEVEKDEEIKAFDEDGETSEETDDLVSEYNEENTGAEALPEAEDGGDIGLSESSTDQTVIPLGEEKKGDK